MFPNGTSRIRGRRVAALMLAAAAIATAQPLTPSVLRADWRQVGTSVLARDLPSPAGGPVRRVWFDTTGRLYAELASGGVFATEDLERWVLTAVQTPEPAPAAPQVERPPANGALLAEASGARWRIYAAGRQVYRSDDGGRSWQDLTSYHGRSILGAPATDLAVSPSDPDFIAVANAFGVWVSRDAGLSWTGLNEGLPNLPAMRILPWPGSRQGVRIAIQGESGPEVYTWLPGQTVAWLPANELDWRPAPPSELEQEQKQRVERILGVTLTAFAVQGDAIYAGAAGGRIWVSWDAGATWRPFVFQGAGEVTDFFVDAEDARLALVTLWSPAADGGGARLARTLNGGLTWDDISGNLPLGRVFAAVAHRESGSLYAATANGLYFAQADLWAPGPAPDWRRLGGELPSASAIDVKLDRAGNQLYVLMRGYGVYAALAPHRRLQPALVRSADLELGSAAPGDLFTLIGAEVQSATIGNLRVPVLAVGGGESQVQIPYEIPGGFAGLTLSDGRREIRFGLPVLETSPAVFLRADGSPLILDADTGLPVGIMNPARSGSRLQIVASGLGKVTPEWPSGLAAPRDNPPAVAARVTALLSGKPVPVMRATLAPGYVGLYLVEVELPPFVDAGHAELVIEAGGVRSRPVSVLLEP